MKKNTITTSDEAISVVELKTLANAILSNKANIRMQCIPDGGTWTKKFLRVVMVTDKGIVLNDDTTDRMKSVSFLNKVFHFALDKPFESYNSNLGYSVG